MLPSGFAAAQPSFVAFESGHVRPIALSPDGSRLFVVNTPDNTLEIFTVDGAGLTFAAAVPVGMEPVAVAPRTDSEIWVVNHLSDSVSIVDLSGPVPFVARTLLVGDEPRDIVFAGSDGARAFITTAHRGQHRTHPSIEEVWDTTNRADPQFTTNVGRADVWVFDALDLGNTLGGTPIDVLRFFSDTPRALATDGTTVYVAAFLSGNQTTVINHRDVPNGFDSAEATFNAPGGIPGPDDNASGDPAPETGLILKWSESDAWLDVLGRDWNRVVARRLPDNDVFAFDADTLEHGTIFQSVGTVLFNMAVNPSNGKVYVTNTESPNLVRFEGAGVHGGSTVQGHLSEARVTILDPSGPSQDVQHLNAHIDYDQLHTDDGADHEGNDAQIQHSLATPLLPTLSSDGSTIYIPAFGSSRIGVFTKTELENPNFETEFDPTVQSAHYISTTGGGPSGIALDETNGRLYVTTRFNNAVEVIDLATKTTLASHPLHNPEPTEVVAGRPFLYDAVRTSGNGETSCASCHIFGDLDALAWNLGDPDAEISTNNQPSSTPQLEPETVFHPMKGPMTTQTLRGIATHGALHWRGDRLDGFFGLDPCNAPGYDAATPADAPCDEDLSFRNFIVAFEGLLGKDGTLTPEEMQQFSDFALRLMPPPNPVRHLDNSLTTAQQAGEDKFFTCCGLVIQGSPDIPDVAESCNGCHTLDPINGFLGSNGGMTRAEVEGEPQGFKVPHLRNLYTKVGMFEFNGDVVRGTAFLHDGSMQTLLSFLSTGFNLSFPERRNVEQFLLAFPSNLAPIVGQQVTIGPANFDDPDVNDRIDLLETRAGAAYDSLLLGGSVTECDVVVKTIESGTERGYTRQANGTYLPDDGSPAITDRDLRAKADPLGDGSTLTYTAVPPGSGTRMGIDRDEDTLHNGVETNTGVFIDAGDTGTSPALADTDDDGFDDGVEVAEGADPNDPESIPVPEPSLTASIAAALLALLALRARRPKRA